MFLSLAKLQAIPWASVHLVELVIKDNHLLSGSHIAQLCIRLLPSAKEAKSQHESQCLSPRKQDCFLPWHSRHGLFDVSSLSLELSLVEPLSLWPELTLGPRAFPSA